MSTETMGIRGKEYEKALSLEEIRDKLLQEGDGAVALIFPGNHAITAVNVRGEVFVVENYADGSPAAMPIEECPWADGPYFYGVMKARMNSVFNPQH